jgi:hypothetical protein
MVVGWALWLAGTVVTAKEDRFVRERLEDWRRCLIDLSYRNRLLRFAPTRAATLVIDAPGIEQLLAEIDGGQTWGFYFRPKSTRMATRARPPERSTKS